MCERAIYSPSVDKAATVVCFLLFHEMMQSLRVKMYPEIDCWSSISLAQSESLYPVRTSAFSLFSPRTRQNSRVPTRYHKTRSAAFQCACPGFALNYPRWLLVIARSGRQTIVIQVISPTSSQYGSVFISAASSTVWGPLAFDSTVFGSIGVCTGLQPSILKCLRIVSTYWAWEIATEQFCDCQ